MAQNTKKQQQQVMKRRQKQKEAAKKKNQQALAVTSPKTLVRNSRQFPVMECLISKGWDDDPTNLTQIVLSRQQPDGGVVFGVYLVDMACLGLKSTFCNANFSVTRYREEVIPRVAQGTPLTKCPLELAHQIIYEAIDYAAQFGFTPDKDFKWSQFVLEPRGTFPESYKLTFGKDGKPFFIAGPYDNARSIIAKLEATAGPGNYDYVAFAE